MAVGNEVGCFCGYGSLKGNRFGLLLISMGVKSRILVWGRQVSGVLVEGGKLGSRTLGVEEEVRKGSLGHGGVGRPIRR